MDQHSYTSRDRFRPPEVIVFVRIHIELQCMCCPRWVRLDSHCVEIYVIVGSLSVYLDNVLVGLPRLGESEVHKCFIHWAG